MAFPPGQLAETFLSDRNELNTLRDSQPTIPEKYEMNMEGVDETAVNNFVEEVAKKHNLTQHLKQAENWLNSGLVQLKSTLFPMQDL